MVSYGLHIFSSVPTVDSQSDYQFWLPILSLAVNSINSPIESFQKTLVFRRCPVALSVLTSVASAYKITAHSHPHLSLSDSLSLAASLSRRAVPTWVADTASNTPYWWSLLSFAPCCYCHHHRCRRDHHALPETLSAQQPKGTCSQQGYK